MQSDNQQQNNGFTMGGTSDLQQNKSKTIQADELAKKRQQDITGAQSSAQNLRRGENYATSLRKQRK